MRSRKRQRINSKVCVCCCNCKHWGELYNDERGDAMGKCAKDGGHMRPFGKCGDFEEDSFGDVGTPLASGELPTIEPVHIATIRDSIQYNLEYWRDVADNYTADGKEERRVEMQKITDARDAFNRILTSLGIKAE